MKDIAVVLSHPSTVEIDGIKVDFLPYTTNPKENIKSFSSEFLVAHIPVKDAFLNVNYNVRCVEEMLSEEQIISVKDLSRWKKVWLGHFHSSQKNGNLEYIGSPMSLSFADANQEKHIAIYDFSTGDISYIKNNFSPKFFITEDYKKLDEIKNARIRIVVSNLLENKIEIKKELLSKGAFSVDFDNVRLKGKIGESIEKAVVDVKSIKDIYNRKKIIEDFFDSIDLPSDYNKAEIKKLALEIAEYAN